MLEVIVHKMKVALNIFLFLFVSEYLYSQVNLPVVYYCGPLVKYYKLPNFNYGDTLDSQLLIKYSSYFEKCKNGWFISYYSDDTTKVAATYGVSKGKITKIVYYYKAK